MKYILVGIVVLLIPFLFFMMFISRRSLELQMANNTAPSQTIVTGTGDQITDQKREDAREEYLKLSLLERGTIIGYDDTTKIINLINENPIDPTEEIIDINVSNVTRFACWTTELHGVAKTAFFPMEINSNLSLNDEVILSNFSFGDIVGKFAFFKIDIQNQSLPIHATQVAVLDC